MTTPIHHGLDDDFICTYLQLDTLLHSGFAGILGVVVVVGIFAICSDSFAVMWGFVIAGRRSVVAGLLHAFLGFLSSVG